MAVVVASDSGRKDDAMWHVPHSHLTVDKLFPVNPREIMGPQKMSLLLEAKNMPALTIMPRQGLYLLGTRMTLVGT